jgi:DNA polymerase III epsilon subunit-like protein
VTSVPYSTHQPLRLFVDVETTGLDAQRDRIIEVAWVCLQDTDIVERGGSLVRLTSRAVPAAVTTLTGIATEHLVGAPPVADAMAALVASMSRCSTIGAYGADFDRAFLHAAAIRCGLALPHRPWIDVLTLARRSRPGLARHRLVDVVAALGLQAEGPLHRAGTDAALCARVWSALQALPTTHDDRSPLLRLFW